MSIATGPIYVYTEFEATKAFLLENVVVLNPVGYLTRNVGTPKNDVV